MRLKIITSNPGKVREFHHALGSLGLDIEHANENCDEIQADTLEEVVLSCLAQLRFRELGDYVLDDSGLFINALGGFPGVYSSYIFRTIGMNGILKLLDNINDRSAYFECCIGCSFRGEEFVVWGRCDGSIGMHPSGTDGFGFDPIFIPSDYDETFAEMSIDKKEAISHRGRAIRELAIALEEKI
ncbi:MAG: RdgB/HAM1 family non-canonical purine NTP pyrophosphatase [Euryarchaeota archaeon]|nr:RdgB/HAM1 family non-canonical purine NTP pyrophosphatase [Euryarchaeota archaeon]